MDNLSRFYIELATNINAANAFNMGTAEQKMAALKKAGVSNAEEVLAMPAQQLSEAMAQNLYATTGQWGNLSSNVPNDDQKNNIGRLGLKNRKKVH